MAPKADSKEVKVDQNSSSDVVKNPKSEFLNFLHPSPARSKFLGPMEAKMKLQRRQETVFAAIEKDDIKAMLFTELLETMLFTEVLDTFLRLNPHGRTADCRLGTPWRKALYVNTYIDIYIYT